MTDDPTTPIPIRLRQRLHEDAQALATQYGITKARVLQEAIEQGLLTWAASHVPRLQDGHEHYGPYDGPTLARMLRVRLAPVIDLLLRHGELPLLIPGTGAAISVGLLAPPAHPPPTEPDSSSTTIPFDPEAATEGFPGGMDDD